MRFTGVGSFALLASTVSTAVGDWQQCMFSKTHYLASSNNFKVVESIGVERRRVLQHLAV